MTESQNRTDRSEQHAGQSRPEDVVPGIEDRRTELADLVDNLEERIVEERREEAVPGNVDDRKDADPIDTGDRAPE